MKEEIFDKICLNFETGKEVKDVMIRLDGSDIFFFLDSEYPVQRKRSLESDLIFQKYPLLLELQKKLGFDVYGEYIVLPFEIYNDEGIAKTKFNVGDVFESNDVYWVKKSLGIVELSESVTPYSYFQKVIHIPQFEDSCYAGLNLYFEAEYICNIIQELSKHYRGEENKFEEVRKILGL